MVLRSRGALCLICCCCLIFVLQFAAIGLFMFRDRLFSPRGLYYFNEPQRAVRPTVAGGEKPGRGVVGGGGEGGNDTGNAPHARGPGGPQSGPRGPDGLPRGTPFDPSLRRHTISDFLSASGSDSDGAAQEICGPLLLGVDSHHDFNCQTLSARCVCHSPTHNGVYVAPTVSLIGAQKGGSTALLAYLLQVS